jgi:hypothetical protein
MRKTVTTALAVAAFAVTPVAPAHADPAGSARPCVTDEAGEGQPVVPCVWDARHRGNGKGRSFKVRADRTLVYVTHYRAHRLLFGTCSRDGVKRACPDRVIMDWVR